MLTAQLTYMMIDHYEIIPEENVNITNLWQLLGQLNLFDAWILTDWSCHCKLHPDKNSSATSNMINDTVKVVSIHYTIEHFVVEVG